MIIIKIENVRLCVNICYAFFIFFFLFWLLEFSKKCCLSYIMCFNFISACINLMFGKEMFFSRSKNILKERDSLFFHFFFFGANSLQFCGNMLMTLNLFIFYVKNLRCLVSNMGLKNRF